MAQADYKCEHCDTINNYVFDGRRKTPDSVWIYCKNSKCPYHENTRRMWLIVNVKIESDDEDTKNLKDIITKESLLWYELGCNKLNIPVDNLKVEFGLSNSIAGTAYTHSRRIKYNITLAKENQSDFINETIPHEVAHILANRYYQSNCGHKAGWKRVMLLLGKTPSRCHSYDVSNVGRKKIKYNCPCGESFYVGINLHGKIQNGSNHYCTKCKTRLKSMSWNG
jgi:SprT protein